jgi:hypothetical protein
MKLPTVDAFVKWVENTPSQSLMGDSRVAYDAQLRVLHQLQSYLKGEDKYLAAIIDFEQADARTGETK